MNTSQNKVSLQLWLRVDSKRKSNNIVRILSPKPYSPFKIPFKEILKSINEKEGTIIFRMSNVGNLFDKKVKRIWIFDLPKGSSRFLLTREGYFSLVFYHISPVVGVRVAKLDISKLKEARGLHFFVTWSSIESCLHVGDVEKKIGLLSEKAKTVSENIIEGKDGSLLIVGSIGVDVRTFYLRKGSETIVKPKAYDIFKFAMERLDTLINGCTKGDFLFETTCTQIGLVMLVSSFEAYCKERFIELEDEGFQVDFDRLCAKIFSRKYRESLKKEIEEKAENKVTSCLKILVQEGHINFQDFEMCKHAFNKCYGIKFGEIASVDSHLIEKMRKLISFRHIIVHSGRETTILNFDELPEKDHIFANKQLLEDAKTTFSHFVEKLHSTTKQHD